MRSEVADATCNVKCTRKNLFSPEQCLGDRSFVESFAHGPFICNLAYVLPG